MIKLGLPFKAEMTDSLLKALKEYFILLLSGLMFFMFMPDLFPAILLLMIALSLIVKFAGSKDFFIRLDPLFIGPIVMLLFFFTGSGSESEISIYRGGLIVTFWLAGIFFILLSIIFHFLPPRIMKHFLPLKIRQALKVFFIIGGLIVLIFTQLNTFSLINWPLLALTVIGCALAVVRILKVKSRPNVLRIISFALLFLLLLFGLVEAIGNRSLLDFPHIVETSFAWDTYQSSFFLLIKPLSFLHFDLTSILVILPTTFVYFLNSYDLKENIDKDREMNSQSLLITMILSLFAFSPIDILNKDTKAQKSRKPVLILIYAIILLLTAFIVPLILGMLKTFSPNVFIVLISLELILVIIKPIFKGSIAINISADRIKEYVLTGIFIMGELVLIFDLIYCDRFGHFIPFGTGFYVPGFIPILVILLLVQSFWPAKKKKPLSQ
ncbi:MAG TPA: hypothetical protein PKC96_00165 [Bacilli bacterium]|nr:hypothetical protein [Bacilli bacterium]